MPRISAGTIADHRALVWAALVKALDDLLAERDYEQISLADIAARAGIARSSAYNYAADKGALLAAAVAESAVVMVEQIHEIAQEDTAASERLSRVVDYLLSEFAQGSRRLFVLQARLESLPAEQQGAAGGLIQPLTSTIARVIQDGIDAGEFEPSVDLDLDVDLLTGLMDRAVTAIAVRAQDVQLLQERTKALLLGALLRRG